jgi:flagellar hook-associated protein 1 FlgK
VSIFSIGISGLNAAQVALKTTSNNISNVYTPGYNRELTLLGEAATGGVDVNDVERQFNYFVAGQLNGAVNENTYLARYDTEISQIDNLLSDSDAGLAPMMQRFFASLQSLAGTPADSAARQGVIGAADTMSAQFRSLSGYLAEMQDGVASQLRGEVSQVNTLAAQIAKLNEQISISGSRSGGVPNALLNERDHLVTEISKHLDVQVHIQDGGSYNLTVGNGQPLVSAHRSYELTVTTSSADPSRTVVGYKDSAGNERELSETTFRGGSIGGLMAFRSETLDRAQNQLGQLAVTFALSYNAQHAQGIDLTGAAGQEMFSYNEPRLFSHEGNIGTAVISAAFDSATSPGGLTGSDYDLRVVDAAAGKFEVVRRDGAGSQMVTVIPVDPADPANLAGTLSFDGMVLNIDDVSLLKDGDSFQLQPTRHAAEAFGNLIHDPAQVAASYDDPADPTDPVGASGDNRNALKLLDLQNQHLFSGRFTLTQGYMTLVNDVGNRSNVVKVNLKAQTALTEQIEMLQQSESGVNLDEEATNIIRYQQFYQANAKVIETGSVLLDVILGIHA